MPEPPHSPHPLGAQGARKTAAAAGDGGLASVRNSKHFRCIGLPVHRCRCAAAARNQTHTVGELGSGCSARTEHRPLPSPRQVSD